MQTTLACTLTAALTAAITIAFNSAGSQTPAFGHVGYQQDVQQDGVIGPVPAIDASCIITPRPTIKAVSSVMRYEYEKPVAPKRMWARFTVESALTDNTLQIEGRNTSVPAAKLDLGETYQIDVTWTGDALTERPTLAVSKLKADGTLEPALLTGGLGRFAIEDLPLTYQVMNLEGRLPHVVTWASGTDAQVVYVKTGTHWIGFEMSRVAV
jgi:hypothetical protein